MAAQAVGTFRVVVDCSRVQLGINVYGREVTHVAPGGAAAKSLREGDLILEVDGKEVRDDGRRLLIPHADTHTFLVRRSGGDERIFEIGGLVSPRSILRDPATREAASGRSSWV